MIFMARQGFWLIPSFRLSRRMIKVISAICIVAITCLMSVHYGNPLQRTPVMGQILPTHSSDLSLEQELLKFRRKADQSDDSNSKDSLRKKKDRENTVVQDNATESTGDVCTNETVNSLGRHKAQAVEMDPTVLAAMLSVFLENGGHHKPRMCQPAENTAIIIPYRDRKMNLNTLLPILIPILVRQKVEFTIYIVEQDPNSTFNKGLLFNAGVLEALKVDDYDCFILHDVDLIPLDDRNTYRCNKTSPVHFAASLSNYEGANYKGLFGGVVGFTRDQFQKINGASNMYFGWGGEDDDLRDRALNKNMSIIRKNPKFAVYYAVSHGREGSGWKKNPERFHVFKTRLERQDIDGLNSARYTRTGLTKGPLYTLINVAVNQTEVLETVPENLRKGSKEDLNYHSTNIINS